MLKTIPNHWFTWNCEVLEGNVRVASIYFNAWGEAGELIVEGFRYRVYRESPLSGTFILEEDDNSIAWAVSIRDKALFGIAKTLREISRGLRTI